MPSPRGRGWLLRTLFACVAPFRRECALLALTVLIGVAYGILVPLAFKLLFDRAIPGRDARVLAMTLAALGALYVLNAVAKVGEDHVVAVLSAKALRALSERMHDHLLGLSESCFREHTPGDLVSRFSTDVQAMERIFTRTLPGVSSKLLMIAAGLAAMFALDWRLALVVLAMLPLSLLAPERFRPRALAEGREKRRVEGEVVQHVQEGIAMQRAVTSLGIEGERRRTFAATQAGLVGSSIAANFWSALVWRAADLGVGSIQLVVMGVGAAMAFRGALSAGDLVAFLTLIITVSAATSSVAGFMPDVLRAEVSMHRIQELLSWRPGVVETPAARDVPRLSQEIRLSDVSFGYTEGRICIDDATLTIPAGRSVAFVGPSGAGKSTILSLLLRLHDPWQGRITIDGVDLRTGALASLRRQIGVVPQDTVLFNTTVRENIRLGRIDATDEEIVAAARAAEVHDSIVALPGGYDATVGERGAALSGGQRQRIAIARALVRDPRILLLDEATSALDPETESAFNATLRGIRANRTVLAVTHRLSTIRDYDEIVVIDRGRVVEVGSHGELMTLQGVYHDLLQRQAGIAVGRDGRSAAVGAPYLKTIEWLAGLDDAFLEGLAKEFQVELYGDGQKVFRGGNPADRFYVLARGVADVEVQAPDGRATSVATLHDGDWFGEIALLIDRPRTATVRVRSDAVCLSLHRQRFLALLDAHQGLRARFEAVASARLAALDAHVAGA